MERFYTSTRNHSFKISAKAAIKKGFADDKGLFVLPDLQENHIDIAKLPDLSYQEIANLVLEQLLPDFDHTEIADSVQLAYGNNFTDSEITPVNNVDNFHVLELFHGPTAAFKDIGLQLLPQLMQHSLSPNNQVMILTATSGDTGKAALEGFKDQPQIGITVFYPHKGVSQIQQLQMATTGGNNTNVVAIQGNFDDAQTNVKRLFNNRNLKEQLSETINLSSANSINIGRLIPQVVYYFDTYKQLVNQHTIKLGDHVNFTVPTGNFGDVLAGYYAKLMGLPVNKFIVAANQNNVLADFFESGIYDRNRPFFKTVAPSMDIQISSNFERLLYYKTNGNTKYVSHLMNQLETSGKYQVTPELLAAIKQDFYFGYSSDDDIRSSIHDTYHDYHYLMDPHTAAGYKVMRDYQQIDDQTPMILLSTASPYKFIDVVNQALNLSSASDQQTIMTDINRVTGIKIPNNLINVWNLPVRFTDIIQKNDMQDYVLNKVKEDFQ